MAVPVSNGRCGYADPATGTEKPKPLAQMCAVVPKDAKAGDTIDVYIPATQSSVENGQATSSMLQVKVPASISPGCTVCFSKFDTGWEIGLAKFNLPEVLEAPIPKVAIPGKSDVTILHQGIEVTRVLVPPAAKPGVDDLQATRPEDPSEPWGVVLLVDPDYPEVVTKMAVGATQAALRAPPLDGNIAYSNLVEAVRQAGGEVNPKMTRGRAPPLNIPGIVAVEDIDEGEIICKIPKHVHLSSLTAEVNAPEIWQKIVQLVSLQSKGRAEEATLFGLTARLLHDAEDRAVLRQGDASAELPPQSTWLTGATDQKVVKVWEAYTDQLLAEDFTHHPIRLVGEDLDKMQEYLQPSAIANHMYKEAKCMHTLWRIVKAAPQHLLGEKFEAGMFLRAMLNFQSRQFKAAVSRSLIPVADLLNHTNAAEMCVQWRWEDALQAHVLTCVKPIKAGQELLQSYGAHPNASFYRCYNFTLGPEKEIGWCYSLWRDDVESVFSQFVPKTSSAWISEVHLASGEVVESLRGVLKDVAENGGNPAYFLRLACMRAAAPFEADETLKPALASLKKAREEDPRTSAWWEHLQGADKALTENEAVRIQMGEYLCLVAHLEAIDVMAGEMDEERTLLYALHMRLQLRQAILDLHEVYKFT